MNDIVFLTRASMPPFEEYTKEIEDCWKNRWITSFGPKHNQLEKSLKDFFHVKNLKLFANGHSALENTIQAFGLEGEIITTPFTFASTTHAIMRNNLIPRFCDINLLDFNIDVEKIERLITPNTSAILPVHLFGRACDVTKIDKIAKKYNLTVIYDAAHAFGIETDGKTIAEYGDASVFSFHASKVFNSIEGGAVVYKDSSLDSVFDKLRTFGSDENEFIEFIGSNGKMNEFEAAMGLCNLRHFYEELEKRKKAFDYYHQCLSDVIGIKFPVTNENQTFNYSYFPVIITDSFKISRDELLKQLNSNGILARRQFFQLANHYPCYPTKFAEDKTENAEYISKRILTLPLYSGLDKSTIDYICSFFINV